MRDFGLKTGVVSSSDAETITDGIWTDQGVGRVVKGYQIVIHGEIPFTQKAVVRRDDEVHMIVGEPVGTDNNRHVILLIAHTLLSIDIYEWKKQDLTHPYRMNNSLKSSSADVSSMGLILNELNIQ